MQGFDDLHDFAAGDAVQIAGGFIRQQDFWLHHDRTGYRNQLSLATGMAAAGLMLQAGVGILRTLPPARDSSLAKLRRTAGALGIRWPHDEAYPAFVRGLDGAVPAQAAMLNSCTMLFRGAGYQAFRGTIPEQPLHAAIAAAIDSENGVTIPAASSEVGPPQTAPDASSDEPAVEDRHARRFANRKKKPPERPRFPRPIIS